MLQSQYITLPPKAPLQVSNQEYRAAATFTPIKPLVSSSADDTYISNEAAIGNAVFMRELQYYSVPSSPPARASTRAGSPVVGTRSTMQGEAMDVEDDLKVDDQGFFVNSDLLVRKYSPCALYHYRCLQVGVPKPNSVVEQQLFDSYPGSSWALLESLDCSSTYLGNKGFVALAAVLALCKHLRVLTLSGVGLRGYDPSVNALCRLLGSLPVLEYVNLSCNFLDDHVGRQILRVALDSTSLQEIQLSDTGITLTLQRRIVQVLQRRLLKPSFALSNPGTLPLTSRFSFSEMIPHHSVLPSGRLARFPCETECSQSPHQRTLKSAISSALWQGRRAHCEPPYTQMNTLEAQVEGEEMLNTRRTLPPTIAAALVELRRRLQRNRHDIQGVYECFLLSKSMEQRLSMSTVAQTRSEPSLRCDQEYEALTYMELIGGEVDEETLRDTFQGSCSWKAFFRGLRILGVHSASKDLSRAIELAGYCGIVDASKVEFGGLIQFLRCHVHLQDSQGASLQLGSMPSSVGQVQRVCDRLYDCRRVIYNILQLRAVSHPQSVATHDRARGSEVQRTDSAASSASVPLGQQSFFQRAFYMRTVRDMAMDDQLSPNVHDTPGACRQCCWPRLVQMLPVGDGSNCVMNTVVSSLNSRRSGTRASVTIASPLHSPTSTTVGLVEFSLWVVASDLLASCVEVLGETDEAYIVSVLASCGIDVVKEPHRIVDYATNFLVNFHVAEPPITFSAEEERELWEGVTIHELQQGCSAWILNSSSKLKNNSC